MRYRFFIVDVFTRQAFGGNQLAVLPDARGLSDAQMQAIAREFNFSESTFVLPPQDSANTRQVRIFSPFHEMPFAGHPNVGTAFALAACGEVTGEGKNLTLRFEEIAGLVTMRVDMQDGRPIRAELTAPKPLSRGPALDQAQTASLFKLNPADILMSVHPPCIASVGVEFLCVQLRDRNALAHSQVAPDVLQALPDSICDVGFLLYTRDVGESEIDIRARMYAPGHGVAEDPATGGAACALAGLLGTLDQTQEGQLRWRIAQGIEMGRPSLLEASVEKHKGQVSAIRVGGGAVLVAEGWLEWP